MLIRFRNQFVSLAFSLAFLAPTPFADAMTVDVAPSAVSGVALVSADIAKEVGRTEQRLVVRLRNDGAPIGETVHVFTIVRAPSGQAKRGYTNLIEISVGPGQEQVAIVPIKSADDADHLTIELVDPAGSEHLDVFGLPVKERGGGSQRSFVALSAPDIGYGQVDIAQGGGEACPFCEWCLASAQLLCGGAGAVESFSCNCPDGPCDITCQGQ